MTIIPSFNVVKWQSSDLTCHSENALVTRLSFREEGKEAGHETRTSRRGLADKPKVNPVKNGPPVHFFQPKVDPLCQKCTLEFVFGG